MAGNFDEQHMDVLQNIEFAIMQVYRAQPELSDYNVDKAVGALVRVYQSQVTGRAAPKLRLREIEQAVFDAVKGMCDWRLGDVALTRPDDAEGGDDDTEDDTEDDAEVSAIESVEELVGPAPKTTEEIVACLKRIRKSVGLWTKQGGRQGYLTYIAQFIM